MFLKASPRRERAGKARLFAICISLVFLSPEWLLVACAPAFAAEIPFATAATIEATPIPVDDGPREADFDGDGDLDVVAVLEGEIVWYENTAGDASAWVFRVIDDFPSSLETGLRAIPADLDRDGDVDLLALWDRTTTGPAVGWIENDGASPPAWSRTTITGSLNDPSGILPADMDGDGDLDAVVLKSPSSIQWLANDGAGTFSLGGGVVGACENVTFEVGHGDIDADGDVDFFAICDEPAVPPFVRWFRNDDGTGTSWTATDLLSTENGSGHRPFHVVDYDGDGDKDLIALKYVYVNLSGDFTSRGGDNAGDGTIDISMPSTRTSHPIDIDHDGDIDLLESGSRLNGEPIGWWESNSSGLLWGANPIPSVGSSVKASGAVDLDGDGDSDVLASAVVNVGSGQPIIPWYENLTLHQSALFIDRITASPLDRPLSIAPSDLDRDGHIDLVVARASASFGEFGSVHWLESDGASTPSFTSHDVAILAGANSADPVDMDRDGDVDVLVAASVASGPASGALNWFENDGATPPGWTARSIVSTSGGGTISFVDVVAADLDRDGDPDALAVSQGTGGLRWYQSNGGAPPTFTARTIPSSAAGLNAVHAADVDDDGDLDVLTASTGDARITWYESDGNALPSFTEHVIATDALFAVDVTTADIDGDGDLDAISASFSNDRIAWHENLDGAGTFGPSQIVSSVLNGASAVHAADFDHDKDVDLVAVGYDGDEVAWFENDGASPPGFTPHSVTTAANGATAVGAVDLDGDGDVDLLATSALDDKVAWHPNVGGQFGLTTSDSTYPSVPNAWLGAVLRIDVHHRGRSGDSPLEMATVNLAFDDGGGTPLTTSQASALLSNIEIWSDVDGSGSWSLAGDSLVTQMTSFSLTSGELTIALPDADPLLETAAEATETLFVVVQTQPDAGSQTPNQFRVTHRTTTTSTAEDAVHDLPLTLEASEEVSTQTVLVPEPGFAVGLLGGLAMFWVMSADRRSGVRTRRGISDPSRSMPRRGVSA